MNTTIFIGNRYEERGSFFHGSSAKGPLSVLKICIVNGCCGLGCEKEGMIVIAIVQLQDLLNRFARKNTLLF
jgi:hypothetical protein